MNFNCIRARNITMMMMIMMMMMMSFDLMCI